MKTGVFNRKGRKDRIEIFFEPYAFSAVVSLLAYSQGCSWAAFVPAILPATKHSVIFPASK
jgi:hypothetical protein